MSCISFGFSLLLASILFYAPNASAQADQRPATHIDSMRAARKGPPVYVPATFTFRSGKQVRSYVEQYQRFYVDRIPCYESSPAQIPPPPLKAVSIDRLKSMSVEGHELETLYVKGKPLRVMTENMAAPGPLEIFGYAITKSNMPIPIPLPGAVLVIPTGTHDKDYWYVRQAGGELQEVPRSGKQFADFMSKAFAAQPALAARIRQRSEGAEFKDMPALVKEYNEHIAGE
ncbi:hypothetical protein Q5H93_09860 [Hymenobacter sp. ASUV-10]|uniref:GLPGLI family protein n=1 Tax=Hymenobacter aranciens TaxID=3063996 RepID=A0ABT9BBG4_9BACT|nr:hypothetical protein [Hymenobacter sp. ASUV-10]MDO7875034.1 hypothetical protein [Hymenobacter sp. ASUV-10]